MKKYLLAAFVLLSANAYGFNYYFPVRKYHLAVTASNPLSLTFKYGGGFETRFRNFAFMPTYFKYTGAYPGYQMNLEFRQYLRKRWLLTRHHFIYQNFIWLKGTAGVAGYDGPKLSVLGYDSKVELPFTDYYGVGAGIGRRYSKSVFFVTAKAGLKFCALPELSQEDKNVYRLFYTTGPGSILEVQFQFGIQL